jgi:hypothetical protein
MLQSRPASASGILQTTAQNQVHQFGQGSTNGNRNSYHNLGGGSAGSNTYRGHTSMAPIAPYAFTSTPALTNPRQQYRTASAPTVPTVSTGRPSRYPAPASVSTTTSSSSSNLSGSSASDLTSSSGGAVAAQAWETTLTPPQPTIITSTPSFTPATTGPSTPTKAAPDRYRRPAHRRADTVPALPSQPALAASIIGNPNVGSLQQSQAPQILAQNFNSGNTLLNGSRGAIDDMYLRRHAKEDQSRRRSIHTIEGFNIEKQKLENFGQGQLLNDPYQKPTYPVIRPSSSPGRNAEYETIPSNRHSEPRAPVSLSKYGWPLLAYMRD